MEYDVIAEKVNTLASRDELEEYVHMHALRIFLSS
jgi:hypothetical protein